MALSAMFTLAGYEFVRSAATVLFKSAYGAENLPLVMAVMPIIVFLGVALYSRILSSLGPRRTLVVTSLGSGFVILCCYFLLLSGSKIVTPFLYLTKELYIVLLIEQYWSYINSSLSTSSARKFNGPITGVAGLGSVIGAQLVSMTAVSWGTETMVLMAAFSVIPAALVSNFTYRQFGEPEMPEIESTKKTHMGWDKFRSNPTLAYLLAIVLLSQFVAVVLDLKFQDLLSLEFVGRPDEETAFQGQYWRTLNFCALVLQFVVAPVLLSFVALRWIYILMPVVHLVTIGFAIFEPSIFSVGLAFFFFKIFDYSIFRAAKEVLYVPLSFDERYRTKQIIDMFGYRTGKGASSVIIVVLQRAGMQVQHYYLLAGLLAAAMWIALVFPLSDNSEKPRIINRAEQ